MEGAAAITVNESKSGVSTADVVPTVLPPIKEESMTESEAPSASFKAYGRKHAPGVMGQTASVRFLGHVPTTSYDAYGKFYLRNRVCIGETETLGLLRVDCLHNRQDSRAWSDGNFARQEAPNGWNFSK